MSSYICSFTNIKSFWILKSLENYKMLRTNLLLTIFHLKSVYSKIWELLLLDQFIEKSTESYSMRNRFSNTFIKKIIKKFSFTVLKTKFGFLYSNCKNENKSDYFILDNFVKLLDKYNSCFYETDPFWYGSIKFINGFWFWILVLLLCLLVWNIFGQILLNFFLALFMH